MTTTFIARIRVFFAGLLRRNRRGELSPRRDWAILCVFFAVLAAALLFYNAVLFAQAEYADTAPTGQNTLNGHVKTIDRNRLGEAVAAFRRLQATFDETEKASSSPPRPE